MSEENKETLETENMNLKGSTQDIYLETEKAVIQQVVISQNQQSIQEPFAETNQQIKLKEEGDIQEQKEQVSESKEEVQNLEVNLEQEGELILNEEGNQTENKQIDVVKEVIDMQAGVDGVENLPVSQQIMEEEQIPEGQYQYQEHLSDKMEDFYDNNLEQQDSQNQQAALQGNQHQPFDIQQVQQHIDETKTEKSYVSYQYQQIPVEEYREEDFFSNHHQNKGPQEEFNFIGVEYVGQKSFLKQTNEQSNILKVNEANLASQIIENVTVVALKQDEIFNEQPSNSISRQQNLQKKQKSVKIKKQGKASISDVKKQNFQKKKIQKVIKTQTKSIVVIQNKKIGQKNQQKDDLKKQIIQKSVITKQNDKVRKIVPEPLMKQSQEIVPRPVEEIKKQVKKQQFIQSKKPVSVVNENKINVSKQQKSFIKQLPKANQNPPLHQVKKIQQSLIRQIPIQSKIAYTKIIEQQLNQQNRQQTKRTKVQEQKIQERKTIVARKIDPPHPPEQNDIQNKQLIIQNLNNQPLKNSSIHPDDRLSEQPLQTKQKEIRNDSVSVKKKKKKPKADHNYKGKQAQTLNTSSKQQITAPLPKNGVSNQLNNKQEVLPSGGGRDGRQPIDRKTINNSENQRGSISQLIEGDQQPVLLQINNNTNEDHIPITSQFIIKEAEKERMRTTHQMFLGYIANYSKALVFYKRIVENVAQQIGRKKNEKRNLMNILVNYFQNYAKLNRQFNQSCNALQMPQLPASKNPFGNIKLQLRKGFDELIYLRRTVSSDCHKIGEFVMNNTLQAIAKAFARFNDRIYQEEMKYFQKREIHRSREKLFYKVIGQVDKVFIQGIEGKYKKDILSEIARLVNEQQGHRQILRMYGRSILPVRHAYIAAQKELFEVLQLILNQFKNQSKVIYSVGRTQFFHIEDLSRNIKEQTDFKQLSPLTDIDYMRYALQVQQKKQRNSFHNRHFQHFLEMGYFDKIVGAIRNLYKGTVNKIFPLATPNEQLIHTISGNLVQFNRQMDHCLNVFIIKNLDAKIVSQGVVEFDEVLKGFIFDDSRTMRVKFRDIDRAEELICYLNQKEEDIIVQETGISAK